MRRAHRDRRLTVTENARTVVEDGDMLLDFAEPDGAKLIAYSAKGCERTFELPGALMAIFSPTGQIVR